MEEAEVVEEAEEVVVEEVEQSAVELSSVQLARTSQSLLLQLLPRPLRMALGSLLPVRVQVQVLAPAMPWCTLMSQRETPCGCASSAATAMYVRLRAST